MLQNIRVASPCSASWESMEGDERKRFCTECNKHVYNLSAMTRAEAEHLLSSSQANGERICGRFYRRADGTVLTEDCPVGLRAKVREKALRLRRRWGLAISGAFGLVTAFAQSKPPEGVHVRLEESAQAEIAGTVSDPTGAWIPNALVTVTDLETGKSTTARSDSTGRYRVPASDELSYAVRVEFRGFKTATVPSVYAVAQHRRVVDVALQIALTNMGGLMVEARPATLGDKLK